MPHSSTPRVWGKCRPSRASQSCPLPTTLNGTTSAGACVCVCVCVYENRQQVMGWPEKHNNNDNRKPKQQKRPVFQIPAVIHLQTAEFTACRNKRFLSLRLLCTELGGKLYAMERYTQKAVSITVKKNVPHRFRKAPGKMNRGTSKQTVRKDLNT